MTAVKGPPSPVLNQTLATLIATELRHDILSGELRPGQRLPYRVLEDRMGTSAIPIREALQKLEAEGLVENVPQRGPRVTSLSIEELTQVYDMRRLLEPQLAERAAAAFSDEQIIALRSAAQDLSNLSDRWSQATFAATHRNLHWLILAPGATALLERSLRHLWQISDRYTRFALEVGSTASLAEAQHQQMVVNCAKKDGAAQRQSTIDHLDSTEQAVRKKLQKMSAAMQS